MTAGTRAQDEPFAPAREADHGISSSEQELPLPPVSGQELPLPPPTGIGNDDVREMANAQFSETTILAVIAANETRFDVSPRALVALKTSGVTERVIEAMVTAETAKKQTAAVPEPRRDSEPDPATGAVPMPSEEFLKLSTMIEQLAAQQQAAAATRREPDPPPSADPSPHAWIVSEADKTALAPTIAQVAFTDERGSATFKTLQGLASNALAFTNPAVNGIATTLGSLFKPDSENRTAVWALAGSAAARELAAAAVFEIEFGNIPGVDPNSYRPAIVRLVRTTDNYRLVAAAKTDTANKGTLPRGPIIEEPVVTELTPIARGHYRAASKDALGPGEYALVLRPIAQKERGGKRRSSDASLGELLGGGTSQILYFTWDFSVAAR